MNYYNEFDPNAAAWLRGLIAEGLIPAGEVDERSINDVSPTDLFGFTQCHFFAGIGGWSLALALAGWPEDEPVWTGSCPCQPFSSAGKGMGRKDPRHLWPAFRRLINRCQPPVVFGEQVASADGRKWLAGVFSNLETMGFAPAGLDLCAAGVRAPHIRQRLWWVGERLADASSDGRSQQWDESRERRTPSPEHSAERGRPCRLADTEDRDGRSEQQTRGARGGRNGSPGSSKFGRMVHAYDEGSQGHDRHGNHGDQPGRFGEKPVGSTRETSRIVGGLGDTHGHGRESRGSASETAGHGNTSQPNDFWSDSRLILCRDGKHRRIPTEPSLFPLADGLPYKLARRGSVRPALLKGAGNAIVPEVAAEFIIAFLETKGGR